MATKLSGLSTFFLPFNKGNGEGIDAGKGNPVNPNGYAVSYVWEDILQKDNLIEILSKFVFVERIEKKEGNKKVTKENIIFPRYHQLDCIRKTLSDVHENKTSQNYLIQHSAGSGKTYTISWLAHRLASFHDSDNKIIYDNIVIVTDRVVMRCRCSVKNLVTEKVLSMQMTTAPAHCRCPCIPIWMWKNSRRSLTRCWRPFDGKKLFSP